MPIGRGATIDVVNIHLKYKRGKVVMRFKYVFHEIETIYFCVLCGDIKYLAKQTLAVTKLRLLIQNFNTRNISNFNLNPFTLPPIPTLNSVVLGSFSSFQIASQNSTIFEDITLDFVYFLCTREGRVFLYTKKDE